MAWTVFNVISSTGNNKSSGSTTGATIYSSISGNWDGTSVFTPTDGSTPASSVTVGDWISICTNASTATSYVAQVTVVAAGVNGAITVSTTAKYGTVLATQTGTCTAIDGGPWADFTPIANFGSATIPASTQFAVKAATFTPGGNLTLALIGTTTAPIWYRGYNTTIGDLDSGSTSLSYPTLAMAANTFSDNNTFATYSGLAFTCSRNGATITIAGNSAHSYCYCRISATASNSNALAVNIGEQNVSFTSCYFSTTSTASSLVQSAGSSAFYGCWFAGSASGTTQIGILSSSNLTAIGNTFYKCGSSGIKQTSANNTIIIDSNTFYKCGSDSITITNAIGSTIPCTVMNNIFGFSGTNGTGYDLNNSSGTNTSALRIINNSSYNPASAQYNGFGDTPILNQITESSNPFTSDTNLALVSTALSAGAGLPGQWENVTGRAYPDVGAWQRQVTSGGGGPVGTNFRGGFSNG